MVTWLKSSDDILPISLNDSDDFSRRNNVGTSLPLFLLFVVFLVRRSQPVDLAFPVGFAQNLDGNEIPVDRSVPQNAARNQDVFALGFFESGLETEKENTSNIKYKIN